MPDVYSLTATFSPTDRASSAAGLVAEALDSWIRRKYPGDQLPPLEPSVGWARKSADNAIVRWEVFDRSPVAGRDDGGQRDAGATGLYELIWRHLHQFEQSPYLPGPESPEVWWSTRVSCLSQGDGSATLAVRVSNSGPAVTSPIVLRTNRPRFLLDLARRGKLAIDGEPLTTTPKALSAVSVADLVRFVLFDPGRRTPIALLSPRADGTYALPPHIVAQDLFTLATVYTVATPGATFALTDALGRRELSAFHGALRVYLPGLRLDSDPLHHPLLTAARLTDPTVRGRLAAYLALRTPERVVDDPRFAMLRDERAAYEDARRGDIERALELSVQKAREAGDYQALAELYSRENSSLREQLRVHISDLEEFRAQVARLEDERRRLRFALEQRGSSAPETADAAPELPPPESVRDAVDQAAVLFKDRLHLLPNAFDSADDSPYEHPDEVLRALQVLARLAEWRARDGGLGKPFDEACKEEGLEYGLGITGNTSKKHRRQYESRDEARQTWFYPEHIKLGSSRDPRFCARIYFTSDVASDAPIVVGHVGRHLDVGTT